MAPRRVPRGTDHHNNHKDTALLASTASLASFSLSFGPVSRIHLPNELLHAEMSV